MSIYHMYVGQERFELHKSIYPWGGKYVGFQNINIGKPLRSRVLIGHSPILDPCTWANFPKSLAHANNSGLLTHLEAGGLLQAESRGPRLVAGGRGRRTNVGVAERGEAGRGETVRGSEELNLR